MPFGKALFFAHLCVAYFDFLGMPVAGSKLQPAFLLKA